MSWVKSVFGVRRTTSKWSNGFFLTAAEVIAFWKINKEDAECKMGVKQRGIALHRHACSIKKNVF